MSHSITALILAIEQAEERRDKAKETLFKTGEARKNAIAADDKASRHNDECIEDTARLCRSLRELVVSCDNLDVFEACDEVGVTLPRLEMP